MQLDIAGEVGSMHAVYGTMNIELEVRHTYQKGGVHKLCIAFSNVIGPTAARVDNKGDRPGSRAQIWSALAPKRKMPTFGS